MKLNVIVQVALVIAEGQANALKYASGYHAKIGIPLANRFRLAEEKGENTLIQRIAGGNVVDISQVPYHVAVLMKLFSVYWSFCGGTLISPTRVLTAAHCYDQDTFQIEFIQTVHESNWIFTGGERRFTTDIEIHPKWKDMSLWDGEADLAIVRIDAVSLSNVIQPVALPSNDFSSDNVGQVVIATGYGLPYEDADLDGPYHLAAVTMPIIESSECFKNMGSFMPTDQICTSNVGGRGLCVGDDGGPLIQIIRGVHTLIGVGAYFSFPCGSGPSSFTRVANHLPWITSN
ncbi:brachyurin-like [Leguminivora glycinivorella]|uniref:brachyurin-like n=1 Tax=Leguminivora glycinivorella TaxID=1035111 RepID=UPI0020100A6F|nr:brachyurin-like [Leguminivora glycinivorella]